MCMWLGHCVVYVELCTHKNRREGGRQFGTMFVFDGRLKICPSPTTHSMARSHTQRLTRRSNQHSITFWKQLFGRWKTRHIGLENNYK